MLNSPPFYVSSLQLYCHLMKWGGGGGVFVSIVNMYANM